MFNAWWKLRLPHASDRQSAWKEWVADQQRRWVLLVDRLMHLLLPSNDAGPNEGHGWVLAAVIMACCTYWLRLVCVWLKIKSIQKTGRLYLKKKTHWPTLWFEIRMDHTTLLMTFCILFFFFNPEFVIRFNFLPKKKKADGRTTTKIGTSAKYFLNSLDTVMDAADKDEWQTIM